MSSLKSPFAGKLPKKGKKDNSVMFGGGFFDSFVDFVWNMLSWSRIDPLEVKWEHWECSKGGGHRLGHLLAHIMYEHGRLGQQNL